MSEGDSWQPSVSLDILKQRAQFIDQIRVFMASRDILEVETPYLSAAGNTDPNICNISLSLQLRKTRQYFLHSSPEFAMKRLLAAGSGAIYQICRVFRDLELSALHQPEFTMLEWYRPGFDHYQLMDELAELLSLIGFQTPVSYSFRQIFLLANTLDPHKSSLAQLIKVAVQRGLIDTTASQLTRQGLLDFIISDIFDKEYKDCAPMYVHSYPACMCALAKIEKHEEGMIARRFELIIHGVEIANGYDELRDPDEHLSRVQAEASIRQQQQQADIPIDTYLIEALKHGLPSTAGVAVGLERLFMLLIDADTIGQTRAFDFERC